MKTQRTRGASSTSLSCRRRSCFTLRGRKKDGVIQGKLRIRSIPGAFLVLGIIVVVVGTALAVAGYWPDRVSRSSVLKPAERGSITDSQTPGLSLGTKSLLPTASFTHTEQMKLLGPVIMGVGLFILICANTVLYENRDRETQMLLAQMRSVICSVSAAVPSTDLSEMSAATSRARHYQWVSSLPAAHLNILCLQQLTSSEPLLCRGAREQEERVDGIYQEAVLLTEALHHQKSASSLSPQSSHSSDSCNCSKTNCNTWSFAEPEWRAGLNPELSLLFKPTNFLMSANSMSTLEGDDCGVPTTQLRRCHSMSYRTNTRMPQNTLHLEEGPLRSNREGQIVQHKQVQRDSLQVCMNKPGQVADPQETTPMEEQTYHSRPQLDFGCGRKHLKQENKEDSPS